jgi:hypothetical protein
MVCRRSTAVVQRFCKPKVGSSILSAGTRHDLDSELVSNEAQIALIGDVPMFRARLGP